MSISNQIERINDNINATYIGLEGKGASIPVQKNSANLRSTVNSLPDIRQKMDYLSTVNTDSERNSLHDGQLFKQQREYGIRDNSDADGSVFLAKKTDLPVRISELQNDVGYLTENALCGESYIVEEADRVIGVLTQHQGSRTYNIGIMSDAHIYAKKDYDYDYTGKDTYYNYHSARHANQGMARISESIHLNACAVLGDNIVGNYRGYLSYEDGVAEMNRYASRIKTDRHIRLIGNHDSGYDGTQLEASYIYPFITAYNSGMTMGDFNRGYGYHDDESFKLRIIALNTCEYDENTVDYGSFQMSDKQCKWFAAALDLSAKENAAQWQILILSHHPLDWGDSSTTARNMPVNILIAYGSGGSITIGDTVVNYSEKNSAVIIGNIHGHLHNYLSGTIDGTSYKRWCCPSVCFDSSNRYYGVWREATTYGKTIRSAEDTAFAILSIDLDSHTLSRIHYGAGYDTVDDIYYTTPSGYTNLVPTSIEGASGKIYNGVGYADGYRLGSNGLPSAQAGCVAAGYIPAAAGDIIRFKGVTWSVEDTGTDYSGKCYIHEVNSTFNVIGSLRNDGAGAGSLTKDGDVYVYTMGHSTAAYIRINGVGSGTNLIITKNEEIK